MKIELSNDDKELLQLWANADATCGCGGHFKAEQNERLRREYALKLLARGIVVPKDIHDKMNKSFITNVELPKGIFNGNGSY